jgi:hypothetical protein
VGGVVWMERNIVRVIFKVSYFTCLCKISNVRHRKREMERQSDIR